MNVLDVPGFNQHRESVFRELIAFCENVSTSLILPIATIIETGNHIAHVSDGRLRRRSASVFRDQVRQAISGLAPWAPTSMINLAGLSELLDRFPEAATQGIGLADLSIIREWEVACDRHPRHRVRIWSLDKHLDAYNREPERI
jgi:hypothetical protein